MGGAREGGNGGLRQLICKQRTWPIFSIRLFRGGGSTLRTHGAALRSQEGRRYSCLHHWACHERSTCGVAWAGGEAIRQATCGSEDQPHQQSGKDPDVGTGAPSAPAQTQTGGGGRVRSAEPVRRGLERTDPPLKLMARVRNVEP